MMSREEIFLRRQQSRWLRPDNARWVRPDAARFLKPGADLERAFPALAQKYSPSQPRIPAGNGRESGRWGTAPLGNRGGGIVGSNDVSGNAQGSDGSPMGEINFGDLSEIGDLNLFQITPGNFDLSNLTQLAGDLPEGNGVGVGHNQGPGLPGEEPPEIPSVKPSTSKETNAFLRSAASFLARNGAIAGGIFIGAMNNVGWLSEYSALIEAEREPPKSLEELYEGAGQRRPGYDDHHIVEQTWAEYFGFSRSQIDDPSNLASIPRLKHYQINGWYARPNEEFGGLSPRQYLQDKTWDERMRVGLDAMIKFRVLKP